MPRKFKYIPKRALALMCMSFEQETKTYDELIRMTHKELSVRLAIFIFSYRSAFGGIGTLVPSLKEMIIGSHAQKKILDHYATLSRKMNK